VAFFFGDSDCFLAGFLALDLGVFFSTVLLFFAGVAFLVGFFFYTKKRKVSHHTKANMH